MARACSLCGPYWKQQKLHLFVSVTNLSIDNKKSTYPILKMIIQVQRHTNWAQKKKNKRQIKSMVFFFFFWTTYFSRTANTNNAVGFRLHQLVPLLTCLSLYKRKTISKTQNNPKFLSFPNSNQFSLYFH